MTLKSAIGYLPMALFLCHSSGGEKRTTFLPMDRLSFTIFGNILQQTKSSFLWN
jgi:hypothetical protein